MVRRSTVNGLDIMRRLFLHNNLNRQKEEFQPENAAHVTIYVCGPTVYGPAHIGNAHAQEMAQTRP